MDKNALVQKLIDSLKTSSEVAEREMQAAADAAAHGADAQAKREDARMAIEYGGLALGQRKRVEQSRIALSAIESWHPRPIRQGAPIEVGAIIEVEDEDNRSGRTLFLAPAGAGCELTGPGGDGFLSVITPQSPLGRALIGETEGDSVDVIVAGKTLSYEITWVE
ncbi:MAG: transcription elongation GreA/GreB family factor [Myxococcota bacterium]|jgi:transcription elongation GreA/GreB family factor